MGNLPLAVLGISNIIVGVWDGMVKIGRCFASAGVSPEPFFGILAAVSGIINGVLDVITGPTLVAALSKACCGSGFKRWSPGCRHRWQ